MGGKERKKWMFSRLVSHQRNLHVLHVKAWSQFRCWGSKFWNFLYTMIAGKCKVAKLKEWSWLSFSLLIIVTFVPSNPLPQTSSPHSFLPPFPSISFYLTVVEKKKMESFPFGICECELIEYLLWFGFFMFSSEVINRWEVKTLPCSAVVGL